MESSIAREASSPEVGRFLTLNSLNLENGASSFQLELADDGVATLTFDLPDEKVNVFSRTILSELDAVLDQLAGMPATGLLVCSGKPGQFVAGAKIEELLPTEGNSMDDILASLEKGQTVFARFETLPYPTVALIDGACLGGGAEFALAMDERVATNQPKTQIGLPEVKLGLIPGWGGTQRLSRVFGLDHALKAITTGKPFTASEAEAIGLVFDAVPVERLFEEGRRVLAELVANEKWKTGREQKRAPLPMTAEQIDYCRRMTTAQIRQRNRGEYPAPFAAIEAICDGASVSIEEGLAAERAAGKKVFGGSVASAMIGIFFEQNRLKKFRGVTTSEPEPAGFASVGVLGAGTMGAGIAAASASCGIRTIMADVDQSRIDSGLVSFRRALGQATEAEALARLNTTTDSTVLGQVDIVIEAVTESEPLKAEVHSALAEVLPEESLQATNTSTISVSRLAKSAADPARFVGLHFFNPVNRMRLVEVIRGEATSDQTVVTAVALAKRLGKTPVVVQDSPGFLVNRILLPYMNEAIVLLCEGADIDLIDRVAMEWGMPMGPIALNDLVGLDVTMGAFRVLEEAAEMGQRWMLTRLLDDLVAAGRMGDKTGAGFRKLGRRGRRENDPALDEFLARHSTDTRKIGAEEIEGRLFSVLLLEAARAWEDRIVAEPGDVDMGLVLGTGFPQFRGGPLRHCDQVGAGVVIATAQPYFDSGLGARFDAPKILRNNADTGAMFYPKHGGRT